MLIPAAAQPQTAKSTKYIGQGGLEQEKNSMEAEVQKENDSSSAEKSVKRRLCGTKRCWECGVMRMKGETQESSEQALIGDK